jgi:hypothetical protein
MPARAKAAMVPFGKEVLILDDFGVSMESLFFKKRER